ncbi:MAG: toxin-antitoxin system YwqK family antitoxin, partial [Bacteroidota bacterium]|nr:toxin-antitoxin system YwqK family antitoxin [Bacteroidota bacterium]
ITLILRIFDINSHKMKKIGFLLSSFLIVSFSYTQNIFFDYGEFLAVESSDNMQIQTNVSYYSNGNTKEVFHLLDGKEHGEVVFYHENGLIREKGNYNYGIKNGKWTSWNCSGQKTGEVHYDSNGLKDGRWKIWDSNGTTRAQMNYSNGNRVGKWKIWNEKGTLVDEISY